MTEIKLDHAFLRSINSHEYCAEKKRWPLKVVKNTNDQPPHVLTLKKKHDRVPTLKKFFEFLVAF